MPHRKPIPFPIQVEVELLDRLSEPVRDGRAKSVSDVIRTALDRYDFENVVVMHPVQVQVSVRLAPEIRRELKRISRSRHTSVGQLVRAAVEAYLPELEALPAPATAKPKGRRRKGRARKRRAENRPADL